MVDGWNEDRKEQHEALLWAAWHGAYLQRVDAKHFPSLEKLLRPQAAARAGESPAGKRALAENLKAALMAIKPTGRGEPPAGQSPEQHTPARPNGAAPPPPAG